MGLVASAIAGTLGFCYFVHQQKLAETVLFHQLFTAFNARYDVLNGKLASLIENEALGGVEPLLPLQRGFVVDYFNLCAEEYHYFKLGYIPRNVWRSWCRGMAWHLRQPCIKAVWFVEVKTDSFYGLTYEAILKGAEFSDGPTGPRAKT